jgi:hypothetical protein
MDIEDIEDMPQRNTTPPPPQSTPLPRPGPRSTPFYLLARTAPSLQLTFVVQGMQGEAMDFPAEALDMAFMLKQTLKKKGWKDETAQKSVLNFLEVPMIKVSIPGHGPQIGILET